MTEELREQRLARNQVMFRAVNERVRGINETFDDILDTHVYACECAEPTCVEQVELTPAEYERVRSDPRRFFVAPAQTHVFPEVEVVVERAERYWVVQKLGVAAEVATEFAAEAHA
jgi:hypothetical protein